MSVEATVGPAPAEIEAAAQLNNRACQMIFACINEYPQHVGGPEALVADRVLDAYRPDSRLDRPLDIIDVARIEPDIPHWDAKLREVHLANGMTRELPAGSAAQQLYISGIGGLDHIKAVTDNLAYNMDISTGMSIGWICGVDTGITPPLGTYMVNRGRAARLHSVLKEHPELCKQVIAHIGAEAAGYRTDSPNQKRRAREKAAAMHLSRIAANAR